MDWTWYLIYPSHSFYSKISSLSVSNIHQSINPSLLKEFLEMLLMLAYCMAD